MALFNLDKYIDNNLRTGGWSEKKIERLVRKLNAQGVIISEGGKHYVEKLDVHTQNFLEEESERLDKSPKT